MSKVVMIRGNEYGERVKAVELEAKHFEAINQFQFDQGLKACAVYTKDGEQLGVSRMDYDAAEAMIIGMKKLTHVWKIESELGNHLGYETYVTNLLTGVRVAIYR